MSPEPTRRRPAAAPDLDGLRRWYGDPDVAENYRRVVVDGTAPARRRARERSRLPAILAGVPAGATVLNVACGPGSDLPAVPAAAGVVALDVSRAMLDLVPPAPPGRPLQERVRGDALRLPVADRAADTTLCLRFLHHLPDSAHVAAALHELARVTRRLLVVSHFSTWALEHWIRRWRAWRRGRASTRFALSPRRFDRLLAGAGFHIAGAIRGVPGWSQNRIVYATRIRAD